MTDTCTTRKPNEGETCTCGRPAVTVYVVTDASGTRDVPHCGIPDGGARASETAPTTVPTSSGDPVNKGAQAMEISIEINRETGEYEMTVPTEIESGEEFNEYNKITAAVTAYANWLKEREALKVEARMRIRRVGGASALVEKAKRQMDGQK